MKRFPMLIGLLLAPAGGGAQGLPVDFDPDPVTAETSLAQSASQATTSVRTAPRPVRYAERSVRMVAGTSPMAAELDMRRLPIEH